MEEPWKNSNRNNRLTSLLSEGLTNKKFRMDLRKLRKKDLDRCEGKLRKKEIRMGNLVVGIGSFEPQESLGSNNQFAIC